MNISIGKGSMTSSSSWKSSNDVVSDQFPAGLRVLVVDDDPTCLMILEKMLSTCLYKVTECNRAEHALRLLRENKNGFDIVISDVHMPDMDGFKLLEHIGLEMDLPVIMMSADDGKNVVMKGVTHGACDYLIKPVRIEALRNIWQHVVRKKKNEWREMEQSGSAEEGDRSNRAHSEGGDGPDYSSSATEGNNNANNNGNNNWKSSNKKRRDEDEEVEERDDSSALKKPRVVWSVELHQQFVAAVNQLGIDKAVPKKILELMNVPGLTRENVASHLQKYRLYLRRLSGQHQPGMNNSFMGPQDPAFGPITSLNGIDLHTLAVAGQLPAQSLVNYQAAGALRAPSKPVLPLPLVDHPRNIFNFDSPKLRFGDPQTQQQQPQEHTILGNNSNNYSNNNNKPVNLLHGIPTHMPPMNGTHSGPQSNPLIVQMAAQSQPSIKHHPIISTSRGSGSGSGVGFSPKIQSPSSHILTFPVNQDLPGNSYPLSTVPSYDIFNDLNQNSKPNSDWDSLPGVSLPFVEAPSQHHPNNAIQIGSVDLAHHHQHNHNPRHGFSSGPRNDIPTRSFDNGPVRVKTERVPDLVNEAGFYSDQFGQDDLMSALFKQQESISQTENQFDLDGFSLDNIPV